MFCTFTGARQRRPGRLCSSGKQNNLFSELSQERRVRTEFSLSKLNFFKENFVFRKLFAIEKNKRRFNEMNKNLKSAGVRCATTLNGDFLQLTLPKDEIEFILLDPSCSGSGIRNRHDDDEKIDEDRLERLSTLQKRMIRYALTEFPRLKRMTYSTCSIYQQENEQVVDAILDEFGDQFQVK